MNRIFTSHSEILQLMMTHMREALFKASVAYGRRYKPRLRASSRPWVAKGIWGGGRGWGGSENAEPCMSNKRDIYCKSSAARGAINITNTISCCFSAAYASVLLLGRRREWRKRGGRVRWGNLWLPLHCRYTLDSVYCARVKDCLNRRYDGGVFPLFF